MWRPEEPREPGAQTGSGYPADPGEHELRVLLQRATPRLRAPDGRLGQVRERIARRRRRVRAAGAVALGVTALVLTGTLVPSVLLTTEESAGGPAAAPTGAPDPPAPEPGARSYPGLGSLVLRLPAQWHAREVRLPAGGAMSTHGYVSTGMFTERNSHPGETTCDPDGRTYCLPMRLMRPGDVLIALRSTVNPLLVDKAEAQGSGVLVRAPEVSGRCQGIEGVTSYNALINGHPRPGTAVLAEVCLARKAGKETLEAVERSLTGARFDASAPALPAHPVTGVAAGKGATREGRARADR
ncbi:hypothetical protein [Streptomyces sp. CAU 1734]|uniref:hypothetical protein n=1 Tax=Streptomyces sp. CAU 1734 TaxID=3140360 RepID=UPI003261987C